jgi:2-phospho-L-lactate guanylyltransferase
MSWTAIVPLKAAAERKQRLSAVLGLPERIALSEAMARHVLATLRAVPAIADVHLLSPEPLDAPDVHWLPDRDAELNVAIEAAVSTFGARPVLIVHADLPLLDAADVQCLIDGAATAGCAIAANRHGQGTNAIALTDPRGFHFHFGADSLNRHLAEAGPACALIERNGLAFDCDTPDDLEAIRAGYAAGKPVMRMPEPGTL